MPVQWQLLLIRAWSNPPKIRTLTLKSFPNTKCLQKHSPGYKVQETKVLLSLPADILWNHLKVTRSTKKGNKQPWWSSSHRKKKKKDLIPNPCSEQIKYFKHITQNNSTVSNPFENIPYQHRRQTTWTFENFKLRIQVRRIICKSWESILKVYLDGSYEVLNTLQLQVPAADKKKLTHLRSKIRERTSDILSTLFTLCF